MDSFPVFLNELSCESTADLSEHECRAQFESFLLALKALKKLRSDVTFITAASLSTLSLGGGRFSPASLLGGQHSDDWRFMKGLIQRSLSLDEYPLEGGSIELLHVSGVPAVGLYRAYKLGSLSLSLGSSPVWLEPAIVCELQSALSPDSVQVSVKNVASVGHVLAHGSIVRDYGHNLAESSVVYKGDDFEIRMFFNDHSPPHFHVMPNGGSRSTIARYDIRKVATLVGGELAGKMKRTVETWTEEHESSLLENWDRCAKGQHAIVITDTD